MFHFDITMCDFRVIATGDGITYDVKLYDNCLDKTKDIIMNAKSFAKLLHTMITNDGNGTSEFYPFMDEFFKTVNISNEYRPIT